MMAAAAAHSAVMPASFPLGADAGAAAQFFSTAPLPTPLPRELALLEESLAAMARENAALEVRLRAARKAAASVARFDPPRPRPPARPLKRHCFRLSLSLARWRAQFGDSGVRLRPALSYWESWGVDRLARAFAALRQNQRSRWLERRATFGNQRRLVDAPFRAWVERAGKAHLVRMHCVRRVQKLARSLLRAWANEATMAKVAWFNALKGALIFKGRLMRNVWADWTEFAAWHKATRALQHRMRKAAARFFRATTFRRLYHQWVSTVVLHRHGGPAA